MNKFKTFLSTLAVSFFALLLAHWIPLLIVDPLNVNSFELSDNEFYIKEMRFQAAPIINKIDFDSAIIGTSMAENFSPKEASEALGGEFINLSLQGSLFSERKVVLDYLLSQKNIKKLIISLDGASSIQRNKGIPFSSWSYLYNSSKLDDYAVYANRKYSPYINCHSLFSGNVASALYGECPFNKIRERVADITEWQSSRFSYKRFGGIGNWIKHKNNVQVNRSIEEIQKARLLIENNDIETPENIALLHDLTAFRKEFIPLIEQNPDTQFVFFFPPSFIYKYAIEKQTRPLEFAQYKRLVKRIVLEAEVYSNADVYWFADKAFTNDIANYKDLTHYDGKFNSLFLQEFSIKNSIINRSNVNKLLAELEARALKADLVSMAEALTGED